MRSTLNIQHETPAELAKHLRSVAAKLDSGEIAYGADLTIGNTRIQVAERQESDIRRWARENGFEVGARGRYSKPLQEAYAAHLKAERKAVRDAAKARREARQAEAVSA